MARIDSITAPQAGQDDWTAPDAGLDDWLVPTAPPRPTRGRIGSPGAAAVRGAQEQLGPLPGGFDAPREPEPLRPLGEMFTQGQMRARPADVANPPPPEPDYRAPLLDDAGNTVTPVRQPTTGERRYGDLGTLPRMGEQFRSGIETVRQGFGGMGIERAVQQLQELDQIDAAGDDFARLPPRAQRLAGSAMAGERARQRADAEARLADALGGILASQARQERLAANPRAREIMEAGNAGRWSDVWRILRDDPAGIIQQFSVESTPSSLVSMVPAVAGAALAGRGVAAAVGGVGGFVTEGGPRFVQGITEAMERAGVNTANAAEVQAWVQANPRAIEIASREAGRGALGPAIADALTLGLGLGLRPGAGFAVNAGRVAGNVGIEVVGEAAGEAAGQVLARGEVDKPGEVLAGALGALPQAVGSTAVGTISDMRNRAPAQGQGAAAVPPAAPPGAEPAAAGASPAVPPPTEIPPAAGPVGEPNATVLVQPGLAGGAPDAPPPPPPPAANPVRDSLEDALNDPRPPQVRRAEEAAQRQEEQDRAARRGEAVARIQRQLPAGWQAVDEDGMISVLDPNGDWLQQFEEPPRDMEAEADLLQQVEQANAEGVRNGLYQPPESTTPEPQAPAPVAPEPAPESTTPEPEAAAPPEAAPGLTEAEQRERDALVLRVAQVAQGFDALGDRKRGRAARRAVNAPGARITAAQVEAMERELEQARQAAAPAATPSAPAASQNPDNSGAPGPTTRATTRAKAEEALRRGDAVDVDGPEMLRVVRNARTGSWVVQRIVDGNVQGVLGGDPRAGGFSQDEAIRRALRDVTFPEPEATDAGQPAATAPTAALPPPSETTAESDQPPATQGGTGGNQGGNQGGDDRRPLATTRAQAQRLLEEQPFREIRLPNGGHFHFTRAREGIFLDAFDGTTTISHADLAGSQISMLNLRQTIREALQLLNFDATPALPAPASQPPAPNVTTPAATPGPATGSGAGNVTTPPANVTPPGPASDLEARKAAAKAKFAAAIRAQGQRLNAGIDPAVLSAGIELGLIYIEEGVVKFRAWARAVLNDAKDMGLDPEAVKPALKPVYLAMSAQAPDDVVDQMDDRAAVRAFDLDTLDQAEAEPGPTRPAPQPATGGDTATVFTPSGTPVEVRYELREAGDLVTSNDDQGRINAAYPQELQPRDRTRAASQAQVASIAQGLNPALLGESSSTADGAPMVSPAGIVESGNGRTMAIRRAYADRMPSAQRYRAWLQEQGYDPAGMTAPVLVRVRLTAMDADALRAYTASSNERTTLALSTVERAAADARAMGDAIEEFKGGALTAARNRPFVLRFIKEAVAASDRGQIMDEDGALSQEGRRRIEAALVHAAYDSNTLVAEVFESGESDIKALGGALLDVAGAWAAMRREARAGTISPLVDVTADLVAAVEVVRQARDEGVRVSALLNQTDMFSMPRSPMTMGLLATFFREADYTRPRGRDAVSAILLDFVDTARKSIAGDNLLGDPETTGPDVLRIINDRIRQRDEEAGRRSSAGPDLFATAAAAGDGDAAAGAGGGQPGAQGGGREVGDTQRPQGNEVGGPDAPGSADGVERDSREPTAEPLLAGGDGNPAGADGGGNPAGGRPGRADDQQQLGDPGARAGGAPAGGERGDFGFSDGSEQAGSEVSAAGADLDQRGDILGDGGVSPDAAGGEDAAAGAARNDRANEALAAQRAAEGVAQKPGIENVRATLPVLLPGQQEDVVKAERRFAKADGYGMLFTNGTGTGKTYSGLGIVKRFARSGRKNIIIVVPSEKIARDWIISGRDLLLDITQLRDTKDAGSGIVITTYANFGQNDALATREWDLIVADEAHNLMMSGTADVTAALGALRALSWHPDGAVTRFDMENRPLLDRFDEARRSMEPGSIQRASAIYDQIKAGRDQMKQRFAGKQGKDRSRALFLSATPFAYEKNVEWAQGYLFEYGEEPAQRGYNVPSAKQRFFIEKFGYRMRTNRLTDPDALVDRGLMQRQFNTWLRQEGSLSARRLEVDADYDRRFVLIESVIGNQIDDALSWVREQRRLDRDNKAWGKLQDVLDDQFDYQSRMYLLEAIKTEAAIPMVRKHLELGRKVIVFHDFKQGGGFNPFNIDERLFVMGMPAKEASDAKAALSEFRARFRQLVETRFDLLKSPIEAFRAAFGDKALIVNGSEKPKDRLARFAKFQDDASGPIVIVVQSAMNAGWSGHDTTGKHERVVLNLGLPVAPVVAIQQEGRAYRTGQRSNAMFRYMNTGTNWERFAFASKIAVRASTAESLSMGEDARALKDAYISAFEASDDFAPGFEGEGTGGKRADRLVESIPSPWNRAKSFYFGQQKKNSRTKSQEGEDYFATPEPLGQRMVAWGDARGGDSVLEPSAGHGAIARWFGDNVSRTVIEPSMSLRARLAMVMSPDSDRFLESRFEDLNVVNKYDVIVMNPPFGVGGKTAMEHLIKATQHLREGGRVVALIPTGPAADKRFDAWWEATDDRGRSTHPDLHLIARVNLPTVTFERAGTSVAARIVVIDKHSYAQTADKIVSLSSPIDLTGTPTISALFDRIENMELPARAIGAPTAAGTAPNLAGAPAMQPPPAPPTVERGSEPIVEHTTQHGKVLRGIVRKGITREQARALDPYSFAKDGGFFIREKHLKPPPPASDDINLDAPGGPAGMAAERPITPAALTALRDVLRTIAGPEAVLQIARDGLGGARGAALGPLVRLAYSIGQEQADRTLRHEAIHTLRNMGRITDAEWSVLTEAAERERWGRRFNIEDRYAERYTAESGEARARERMQEEMVAEAFAAWATGNMPEPTAPVARIFQKIRQFLIRLRNAMRGRGFQDEASIFGRIAAGEMGRRPMGERRGPESVGEAMGRMDARLGMGPIVDGDRPTDLMPPWLGRSVDDAISSGGAAGWDADMMLSLPGATREMRATEEPKRTVTAYKLFRRGRDGGLYPLFIGAKKAVPVGQWVAAEHIPTKGFAERPGWHAGVLPTAPHLRTKQNRRAPDRVWAEVEMPADRDWQGEADASRTRDIRDRVPDGGFYRFRTNKMQGGAWLIGGALKVNRVLSDADVAAILRAAGESQEDIDAETAPDDAIMLSMPDGSGTPQRVMQNDAFWEWFGGSKVTKQNGTPLVVYHFTPRGRLDSFYEGSHFGTRAAARDRFESKVNERDPDDPYFREATADEVPQDVTYPVYLSIKNPKRVEDQEGSLAWDAAIELAIEEGYDGLVYENRYEDRGSDSWVAFYPEQVKSAVGNRGTFSRVDADIMLSIPESARDAVKAAAATVKRERMAVVQRLWKGTPVPAGVEVVERAASKDIFPILSRFRLPTRMFAREPDLAQIVKNGIEAERKMARWSASMNDEFNAILGQLKKDKGSQEKVTVALLDADAEGIRIEDAAIAREHFQRHGLTPAEAKAAAAINGMLVKNARLVDSHRRSMMPQVQREKARIWQQMASLFDRGRVESDEYAKAYRRRAYLNRRIREGKGDLKAQALEVEGINADLRAIRMADPENQERMRRLQEQYDDLEARLAATSVRRKDGYFPHKFYGSWRLFELGEVDPETGEPERIEITSDQGFYTTRDEAVAAARAFKDQNPDAKLLVEPKMVTFPASGGGAILSARQYQRLKAGLEQQAGLEGDDLAAALQGVARRESRRRSFAPGMKREGAEGFSEDLDRVMRTHFAQTIRYVEMDRMKFQYVTTMERLGLAPVARTTKVTGDDPRAELERTMQAWWRDLNGAPQAGETVLDRLIASLPLPTATMSAAAITGTMTAMATNPIMGAALGGYLGLRLFRAARKNPDFVTRQWMGDISSDVAHLKLGMFTNVASAVVNLSQTMVNTYPVLGERWTAVGIARAIPALYSLNRNAGARGKMSSDAILLERAGVRSNFSVTADSPASLVEDRGTFEAVKKLSMLAFSTAEQMNRATAFLGALARAEAKGKMPGPAFAEAVEVLGRTQFEGGVATRPEILRSHLLRLPGQFKNFMAQQMGFALGLRRAEIPRFLLSLTLIAGIMGLVLLPALTEIIDWLTGFDPMNWLRDQVIRAGADGDLAGTAADVLARGLPALLGIDISGRVGMGVGFVPESPSDMTGPFIGTVARLHQLQQQGARMSDYLNALSPAANPIRVLEAAANGASITSEAFWAGGVFHDGRAIMRQPTKRGQIAYEPTNAELVAQGLGFRPVRAALQNDARMVQMEEMRERRRDTNYYLGRIIEARRNMPSPSLQTPAAEAMRERQRERIRQAIQEARREGVPLTQRQVNEAIRNAERSQAERDMRNAPRDQRREMRDRDRAIEERAR